MATFSVIVLFLVSSVWHSISGLQLGPFTIPTIANGGALGFSSSFLSAALDPQSRRVSFAAQAPPLGTDSSAGFPSLASLAETFTNPFASFLPTSSLPSSPVSSNVQIPVVSELSNTLRSFSNTIPEGVSRIQNAASSFQNLATNATRAVFDPSAILNRFAQLIPSAEQRSAGTSVPNVLNALNPVQSGFSAFQSLATNASRAVLDPSAILNRFAQLIPSVEQRSSGTRVPSVLNALNPVQSGLNFASNFEVNYSSDNDNENAQNDGSLANIITKAISQLPSSPTVPVNRKDPHYYPGRQVMVHLFEWTFNDIAVECEQFLGPAGYGGVQVSPINEYVIAANRPWWERYQPISYAIQSRSGNEQQFAAMVQRCQRAGVRVYVDIVVNHMAAPGGSVPLYGTAGSPSDPANRQYPAVPYNRTHFHTACSIQNYRNATEVRDCELSGLPDLNQAEPYVRDRIVEFMNRLIELGVAGFRMDASKHMQPEDLSAIYKRLSYLNVAFEFPANAAPFIYQEVIDLGNEAVNASQYTDLGEVTEFKYSLFIGLIYYGTIEASAFLALTKNNATQFGLLPSDSALVFVDNHDNQRGHGAGGDSILTFKDGTKYVQAIAFTLATNYGTVRLMSSYNFTDTSQGPPADGRENILSPGRPTSDGTCQNGWICEHRWPVVKRLVSFRNLVAPAPLTDVQITSGTFAFCRGSVGFAVFNSGKETYNGVWRTCLPAGEYCDIITGERVGSDCTGTRVLVTDEGTISLTLPARSSVVFDLIRRVS